MERVVESTPADEEARWDAIYEFSNQLQSMIVDEWREWYLDYDGLKELIFHQWPLQEYDPLDDAELAENQLDLFRKQSLTESSMLLKKKYTQSDHYGSLGRTNIYDPSNIYGTRSNITAKSARNDPKPPKLKMKSVEEKKEGKEPPLTMSTPKPAANRHDDLENGPPSSKLKRKFSIASEGLTLNSGFYKGISSKHIGTAYRRLSPDEIEFYNSFGLEVRFNESVHEHHRKAVFFEALLVNLAKVDHFYTIMEKKLIQNFHGLLMQSDTLLGNRPEQLQRTSDQEGMVHSFIMQFRRASMLMNFVALNYHGFDKVMLNYDVSISKKDPDQRHKNSRQLFVDKTLQECYFYRSTRMTRLCNQIIREFALRFEGGSLTKARVRLLQKMTDVVASPGDLVMLGVKVGINIVLFLTTLCLIYFQQEGSDGTSSSTYFFSHEHVPIYRCYVMTVIWLWFWGVSVYVWEQYRVNFVWIYEFNPRTRLSYNQLFEEASNLTMLLLVNILLYLNHDHDIDDGNSHVNGLIPAHFTTYFSRSVYPLALLIVFLAKLVLPFQFFSFWSSRSVLLIALKNVIVAPFGYVRFRDCYMGDLLTSFVKILVDYAYTLYFFFPPVFSISGADSFEAHKWIIVPVLSALPLWWRFHQCCKRYYQTGKRWPHLGNAVKYALAHSVVISGSFHPHFTQNLWSTEISFARLVWLISIALSTIYTFTWDCVMDWGLWQQRNSHKKNYFLRDSLVFPSSFVYYFAMLLNFFLRFTWTLTLTPAHVSECSWFLPLIIFLELYRRFQWGLIRVEYQSLRDEDSHTAADLVPIFFDSQREKENRQKNTNPQNSRVAGEIVGMVLIVLVVAIVGSVL